MTYGQRFKLVRKSRFKGTVLDLAQRLKGPKAAPQIVHNIDKLQRVPALKTIARHAKAVGCEPWELLLQVETEFDFARRINALPENQRDECWTMLVSKGPWNLSLVSGQLAQEHDPIPVPTPEGQSDKLALEVNPRSRVQGILSRIVFGKGNENVEVEGDLPDDPAGREQHALRWLDAAAFAGQRAATILRGLPPRTAAPRERDLTIITVADHKTAARTGRAQVVPISAQLRAILEDARVRRPKRSPWVITYRRRPVKSIRGGVRNAAIAAGLPYGRDTRDGLTFHTLRHTASSLLRKVGVDPFLQRDFMGHEHLATTALYTHVSPEELAPAAEQLSAALPISDLVTLPRRRARRDGGQNGGESLPQSVKLPAVTSGLRRP